MEGEGRRRRNTIRAIDDWLIVSLFLFPPSCCVQAGQTQLLALIAIMSFKCKPLKTQSLPLGMCSRRREWEREGGYTYRTQLADIPAKIFGHGHHLVNNRIHFGRVQDSIAVRIVQPEHDCNNEWMRVNVSE